MLLPQTRASRRQGRGQGHGEAALGVWGARGRRLAGRKWPLLPGTCHTWTAPTPSLEEPRSSRTAEAALSLGLPAALSLPGVSQPDIATRLRPQLNSESASVLLCHPRSPPAPGPPPRPGDVPPRPSRLPQRKARPPSCARPGPQPGEPGGALPPSSSSCSPARTAANVPRREGRSEHSRLCPAAGRRGAGRGRRRSRRGEVHAGTTRRVALLFNEFRFTTT